MSEKKSSSIGSRIEPHLRMRLDEIARRYGPNDSRMLEDALSALADYVEAAGKYQRPMKMVFDADADEHARLRAAEDGGDSGESEMVRRLKQSNKEAQAAKDAAAAKSTRAGRK